MCRFRFSLLLVLFALAIQASAGPFTQLVVFGDSLSDTGNFRANNLLGFPGPAYNYTSGRFTDGPATSPAARKYTGVWHEQLAPWLGLPAATASEMGGQNHAYGGATTADGSERFTILPGISARIENLGGQVDDYLATQQPPATALFLVWAGANDLLDDATTATAKAAADRLAANLDVLATAGARSFLVPNLPPLGATPEGRDEASALNEASAVFNAQLAADLSSLVVRFRGNGIALKVYAVDVYSTFFALAANPARFGLTNISEPSQGTNGINPDTWLFWDTLHPTTKGHQLVAQMAIARLKAGPLVATPLRATLGPALSVQP